MMFYIGGLVVFILLNQGVHCDQSEIEHAYQNVLENFNSTRISLNKLGILLHKNSNEKLTIDGVKEIYKILDKHNVYERMKFWKRPTVSQRNTQFSPELELAYKQLPNYISQYKMGETIVKLFNDTKTGYVVCSITFTCDLDYFPLLVANIDHNGTNIQFNDNNCGKHVCLLREDTVNQQQLILIQHNSMFSKHSHTLAIEVTFSKHDTVWYVFDLREDDLPPENTLLTHIVSDIRVDTYRQSSTTYDPTYQKSVSFHSRLEATSDLGGFDETGDASFQNVLEMVDNVAINCSIQAKTQLCDTNVDVSNNQTDDGTLIIQYKFKSNNERMFWRLYISITDDVYPTTQTRPSPIQNIKVSEVPRENVTSLPIHSAFEKAYYFLRTNTNATVLVEKLVNDELVTTFPGFQIEVLKSEAAIIVKLTTYDVMLEDAGMYVVTVSTPTHAISRNFSLDVYKRKLKVFKMTATKYTVKETGFEGINVTCQAAGNPKPAIQFYQQVIGEDYFPIYDKSPKLESNDKWTILPEVHNKNEVTSRSILVRKFPANASSTNVFTVECRAFTKYQKDFTTHDIYKWFLKN